MLRRRVLLLFIILLLPACSPTEPHKYTITPDTPLQPTDHIDEMTPSQEGLNISIWSLGGNGWAAEIGNRILIFDYVETTDPNPPSSEESKNLQSGYINPEEILEKEVFVFVTHSHEDHYNPMIHAWENSIADITYVFGWAEGENPDHHYMIGPRLQGEFGSVKVYTINSYHAGVPEVAFLVDVDGIMIYHNGDYMGSYLDDFNYLSSISNHIDVAFVIGWPFENHQQFQQALLLTNLFSPNYMFASCREGDEIKCHQFANLLGEHGVSSRVEYAEKRGEKIIITLDPSNE
jgi:hypothetical protein